MNILKAIFSGGELVKSIARGADEVHYSSEEKDAHQERMLELYAPFKLAQRFMMMIVCIPYMGAWVITFLVSFIPDVEIESQIDLLTGDVGSVFLAIAVFYFGGGAFEGLAGKIMGGVKGIRDQKTKGEQS